MSRGSTNENYSNFTNEINLSLNLNNKEFQIWDPEIMEIASNLSLNDHFKIFQFSLVCCTDARAKYLEGYLDYILYTRIPQFVYENPEEIDIDWSWRFNLIPILHRLIKFTYPHSFLEQILLQIHTKLTFEEQKILYNLVYLNYTILPIEQERINKMKMFLLVSVYIPDTLLNPLHKLTDIKESFDPFLANVIGHFGPLIVAFGTSQEDFSEELLVRIHQDLFFVDSKPIHLSESLFLFFETLVKSFPNHKSLVFLDKLIKMYLDSDGVLTEPEPSLKEIPYQILLCCKKDYNYMLSHLLTLHHHNLFDHLDLAYLFVQAKRSLNQSHRSSLENLLFGLWSY